MNHALYLLGARTHTPASNRLHALVLLWYSIGHFHYFQGMAFPRAKSTPFCTAAFQWSSWTTCPRPLTACWTGSSSASALPRRTSNAHPRSCCLSATRSCSRCRPAWQKCGTALPGWAAPCTTPPCRGYTTRTGAEVPLPPSCLLSVSSGPGGGTRCMRMHS